MTGGHFIVVLEQEQIEKLQRRFLTAIDLPAMRQAACEFLKAVGGDKRLYQSPDDEEWQPIETLYDIDREVVLWTPIEALYERPKPEKHKPDMRISSLRHWTWATHWMPKPDPPTQSHHVCQQGPKKEKR